MEEISSYPEIYEAIVFVNSYFNVLPKGINDFFRCLSRASPVCSYVFPSEEVYTMVDKLFTEGIKHDIAFTKKLSEKAPIIHQLLIAFQVESRLPLAFKQLLGKLIAKSKTPFIRSSSNEQNIEGDHEYLMGFFPRLPVIRKRGVYQADKMKEETICTKKYASHKKLTAGIFTVYCIHGRQICSPESVRLN